MALNRARTLGLAATALLSSGIVPAVIGPSAALALPLSYAGSTSVGADIDPVWSTLWFSHALERRHGLGLSLQMIPAGRPETGHHGSTSSTNADEGFLLLDSTHLLKRWNLPRAQSNLWLFAGVGAYQSSPGPSGSDAALRLAARPGVQFDIENTRLRLEARGQWFLAAGVERPIYSATAGVGLTPPRYNGVQPWLELQVRAIPGLLEQPELIPKLRLLHQRLVLDLGYSTHGSLTGSITTTF